MNENHASHYWPVWPAVLGVALTLALAGGSLGLRLTLAFPRLGGFIALVVGAVAAVALYGLLTGERSRVLALAVGWGGAIGMGLWTADPAPGPELHLFFGLIAVGYLVSRFGNRYRWVSKGHVEFGIDRPGDTAMSSDLLLPGEDGPCGKYGDGKVLRIVPGEVIGSSKFALAMPSRWGRGARVLTALLTGSAVAVAALFTGYLIMRRDSAGVPSEIDADWAALACIALAFGAIEVMSRLSWQALRARA